MSISFQNFFQKKVCVTLPRKLTGIGLALNLVWYRAGMLEKLIAETSACPMAIRMP
jgi:hypothetical protein